MVHKYTLKVDPSGLNTDRYILCHSVRWCMKLLILKSRVWQPHISQSSQLMRGQCWMLQVSKESPTLTGQNGSVSVSIDAAVAGSWSTLLHPLLVIIQGGTHIIPLAGHPDLLYLTLSVVSWSPATGFQWHVKTEEKYRFTLTHLHEHHIFLFLFLLELKVCGGCRLRLALCWSSNSLINISFKDHVQSPAAEQQPVVLAFKPAASNCNCHDAAAARVVSIFSLGSSAARPRYN